MTNEQENICREITDKDIEQAIRTCHWRLNVDGVDVCRGMCGPCVRVIENGQCDTLQNLFRKRGGADDETY